MTNVKVTRWFTIILVIFLAIAMIFFGILTLNPTMRITFIGGVSRESKADAYAAKNGKVPTGDNVHSVFFLGDSITEMYDLDKYYKGKIVADGKDIELVNRGISTDTSAHVYERLASNVMTASPDKVVMLIGTNDLNRGESPDEIVRNITKIVRRIHYFDTNTKIYIVSVLPVNHNVTLISKPIVNKRTDASIVAINKQLSENARSLGYEYIDVYSLLAVKSDDESSNVMDKQYTMDGLHLSPKGYEVMTNAILPYVQL